MFIKWGKKKKNSLTGVWIENTMAKKKSTPAKILLWQVIRIYRYFRNTLHFFHKVSVTFAWELTDLTLCLCESVKNVSWLSNICRKEKKKNWWSWPFEIDGLGVLDCRIPLLPSGLTYVDFIHRKIIKVIMYETLWAVVDFPPLNS